jgi:mono/diheme cytochrome c family protein
MTNSTLARSTVIILALAALGACHSGSSSTAATGPGPTVSPNTPANPSNSAARRGLPNGVTALMVAQGDSIFHARSCRNCHGADAHGAANGPNLTTGHFMHSDGSYDGIINTITTGIPVSQIQDPAHHIAMPARGGGRPAPLTDEQIRAVAAYIYSLNHQ